MITLSMQAVLALLGFSFLLVISILLIPIYLITKYNGLVKKRNKVNYAFSGVDVMLQKRGELIPNLVESIKRYMTHESDTFSKIVRLRNKITQVPNTSAERFQLENDLSSLLSNLLVNVENYPELKSNENMLLLQRSLNEMEEQISASRRAYNLAVNTLENGIDVFPTNIIAGIFGFKKRPYFEAQETKKEAPDVKKLFN